MRVIALHGYTQRGAVLADALAELTLPAGSELVCPDAPFACDPKKHPAGALTWWKATDDGSEYHGWETTRDLLRTWLAESPGPTAILGFSQGAMVAAAACAWSLAGEIPRVKCAVMVAGTVPRAVALRPLFQAPVDVPSLHVWGQRDPHAKTARVLAELFVNAEMREWDGPHVMPTRGPGAVAIVDFLGRQA